jgi:putative hydrolase of the HAD superfamily
MERHQHQRDPAMKNYLIWDFDGTLAYRPGGWSAALLEVIHLEASTCAVTAEQQRPHLQAGFPWHTPERPHPAITSADQWWNAVEPVFERAFTAIGIDAPQAQRMAIQVRQVYPHPARWRLFDDTLPTLDRLSAQGWSQVILSNHVPELPAIIRHLQLGPYIDHIFNSAQTGFEKPHPQAFRHALAALDEVATVWMIGDSLQADITGATRAGIPAILVRTHHSEARYCCSELSQVVDILGRMGEGGLHGKTEREPALVVEQRAAPQR